MKRASAPFNAKPQFPFSSPDPRHQVIGGVGHGVLEAKGKNMVAADRLSGAYLYEWSIAYLFIIGGNVWKAFVIQRTSWREEMELYVLGLGKTAGSWMRRSYSL